MKKLMLLIVLALVAAACGASGDDTTTTAAAAAAATTTTAAEETTTTAADETTTTATAETTTTAAAGEGAVFAVTEVVFGDQGYVAITNIGSETGNLERWQLCQRPSYFGMPSQELAPGETVYVTTTTVVGLDVDGPVIDAGGRFGSLSASGGEIGLYRDSNFGSTSSIVSYVEWGSSGHARSGVAVGAGIWVDGDFVDAEGSVLIRATDEPPLGAGDWETG